MDRSKYSNNSKIDKRYVNSMLSTLGMTVTHSKLPKTNLFIYMTVYVLQVWKNNILPPPPPNICCKSRWYGFQTTSSDDASVTLHFVRKISFLLSSRVS